MLKKILQTSVIILLLTAIAIIGAAWGSWGHKHINKSAVFSLPEEMRIFYYNHIDFITEGAVVPDLRRPLLQDKAEGPRHFLDVEDFRVPLDSIARKGEEAYKIYDSVLLATAGILPWYIQEMTEKLTTAFKKKNKSEILFLSAELAHYIADAHMPLHTSSNYDGQLTGQKGVHSLWESRIPPMFGHEFNFRAAPAEYISDITGHVWQMIGQSHALVDSVLNCEMTVRKEFNGENVYKTKADGSLVLSYNKPVYSDAYATAFYRQMGTMVEDQLRLSILNISHFWYTAWVNGGKPDLTALDDPALTKRNKRSYKKELKAWKKGKILYL